MLDRSLLLRALSRPQVIIASLLLLGAAALYFAPPSFRQPDSQEFSLPEIAPAETASGEITLVTYDQYNLEASVVIAAELPLDAAQHLQSVLTALRSSLQADGLWPAGLPLPQVFVETLNRQRMAVLDFRPPADLQLTVARELRLLQSLEATVRANGIGGVRFLLQGEPAGIFLLNVAVPDSL